MKGKKIKPICSVIIRYVLLLLFAGVFILPFLWLLSTSLKTGLQSTYSFPPSFIPSPITMKNYVRAIHVVPFLKYIRNTFILIVLMVPAHIFLTTLTAYPLARMKFPGKELIFYLILGTMFMPDEGKLIPLYLLVQKIGMVDSWSGIVFPGLVGGFSVLLMRQAYISIPKEMEEAATIDGCGVFSIFLKIMLPLAKPTLGALGIFSFVSVWNSFTWPLIILKNDDLYPVSLGLSYLSGTFGNDVKIMAAGTTLSLIPVVAFYLLMQKNFVSGLQSGAIKG